MPANGQTTEALPSPPATARTSNLIRLLTLVALTAALVGLCVWLSVPFLPAITWSVALAIMAWPMFQWISRHISNPTVAAGLSTAVVTVVILAAGLFVSYQLAREAAAAAERAQQASAEGTGLKEKAAEVPVAGRILAWMDRFGVDVETAVRQVAANYAQSFGSLVQGSVEVSIQFLVMVFTLFYLFRDRATFLRSLRDLLPLSHAETDQVMRRAADSVHANVYATLITSLIDATGLGLLFWAFGLPAPFLWAVVTFVLSFLPVVGAGLVWGPAVIYLAMSGQWLPAAAVLTWGIGTFLIVDNVLYVRLAGKRMRMHPVPTMIAFLGGVAVFGISGMVLGPAILAVTLAVLEDWQRRLRGAEEAEEE